MPPFDPRVGSASSTQNSPFPAPIEQNVPLPKVTINQGESLAPIRCDSVGESAELEGIKSNFEILRKMKCVFGNRLVVEHLPVEDARTLDSYACQLNRSVPHREVQKVFTLAAERYRRDVWRSLYTEPVGYVFTRSDLDALRHCRASLMKRSELLNGVLEIYEKLKAQLAVDSEDDQMSWSDFGEIVPLEFVEESSDKEYPVRWMVQAIPASDSSTLLKSDVMFWLEYRTYGDYSDAAPITLIDDLDDLKCLVGLDTVRDSIKEQSARQVDRHYLAKSRMRSRLPLINYLPKVECERLEVLP